MLLQIEDSILSFRKYCLTQIYTIPQKLFVCVCVCVHMCVCVCSCVCMCMHVRMCVFMCGCLCVYWIIFPANLNPSHQKGQTLRFSRTPPKMLHNRTNCILIFLKKVSYSQCNLDSSLIQLNN